MKKKFNITGVCIKEYHYMMDVSEKMKQIMTFIEDGEYFTINRPRQYGKTTTLKTIMDTLETKDDYIGISISFEEFDEDALISANAFAALVMDKMVLALSDTHPHLEEFMANIAPSVTKMSALSRAITKLVHKTQKKLILLIDEVDAGSNHITFLSLLAMFRSKYLKRYLKSQATFHSIVLAGVHDVKTLKYKIRDDAASAKYNSPWNIAADFEVSMSFQPKEIATMLQAYSQAENIAMDIAAISEKIYYYTSGYPFLVSALCKIIAEKILPLKTTQTWAEKNVVDAAKQLIQKSNSTNFDSLIKNLENNKDLYDLVFAILFQEGHYSYNRFNPIINLGITYGIFKDEQGIRIHNRIYEKRIYNYMASKIETDLKSKWILNN